ncbi:HD domain-containing protein [Streptomyces olivoreticuli]|uniref:HD domain-containing protein n=1 Tax=Streptomyces olivoreticuli TaxID=68246 RepID=UPI000E250BD8|nr:caspase family protein [Streptomyces olivoreticuli]
MAQVRKALLIGVARSPAALGEFDALDEAVDADLRAMRAALEESGYDVETLAAAGGPAIGTRIFETAGAVPGDGTLLLYFTGHGVRHGDTDYLVPADAQAPPDGVWQEPYLDTLLPADISRYLKGCRAGTVLWLIDACRKELPGVEGAFGSGIVKGPPGGRFALMVGCSPGERCGCTSEGSFFTRGLVRALGSLSAPQTVQEVFEEARTRTARTAHRHGMTQRVWIRYGTDREEEIRAARICDGRLLLEEWRAAVEDDDLWRLVDPATAPSAPRLRDALAALVESCAREVHLAQESLPDPWADEDFPVRLLRRGLLPLLSHAPRLSALEVAALAAAPFLREAVWARRLAEAGEAEPLAPGRLPGAGQQRRHLEQLRDHYAHVARKQAACAGRGRTEDEHAVALWLVHRWIAERFEADEEPVPADLCDRLAACLLGAGDGDLDRVGELSATLASLAAGIGLDTPLDDGQDCPARTVRLPERRQPLRVRPLSALLRLAAALAADVRTFPDIIADHLAVTDPVRPEGILELARHSLDWTADGDGLHLDVLCPHQAVHAALTEIVERADRLAALTRELAAGLPPGEADLLAGVPARVTARGLRPRSCQGRKAYEVPLLRFHLAQTEVRDLLMGRQLYGDPALALRELYQNSLDACRYRAMRWSYLRHRDRRPADWSGRITIVQGVDERGRYVECRDNGIGMNLEQLKNTFTRAGSRFEQSRAFRREQAGWLRRDASLRLHPNSRFGIGVLSYFMLADEMTIVTRHVSPSGAVAGDALRVDIPSSGSLFRVQRHDDAEDGRAEGGTRVRLYLRDDDEQAELSCVAKMRKLVAVSEFHMEVRDDSGARDTWEPNELHGRSLSCVAVPDVLWWVDGEGAVLCDGVATDKKPFGYVLNLTGTHAGTLSVNRNQLLDHDEEWERENWRLGAAALPQWAGLTMKWLWELERSSLPVARVLWEELRGKGVHVDLDRKGRRSVSLDQVGWFAQDAAAIGPEGTYTSSTGSDLAEPWRRAVWRGSGSHGGTSLSPLSLVGHPLPAPGDADVVRINQRFVTPGWVEVIAAAADASTPVIDVVRALRRMRILHPRLAPPQVVEEAMEWVPEPMDKEISAALKGILRGRPGTDSAGRDGKLVGLVKLSWQHGLTLGQLTRTCLRYAPILTGPVPRAPEHHEHHVCGGTDERLLYTERPGGIGGRTRIAGPWDVREVATRLDVPPGAVLEHLAAFAWLGWPVPSADEVDRWMSLEEDLVAVLMQHGRLRSDGTLAVGWDAAFTLSAKRGVTFCAAHDELITATDHLGVTYRQRSRGVSVGGAPVSRECARIMEIIADEWRFTLDDSMDMEMLYAGRPRGASREEFDGAVREMRAIGLTVPDTVELIHRWKDLPPLTQVVLSGKSPWNGDTSPAPHLTSSVLFAAGVQLQEPLGELWRLARQEAGPFGLSVPDLPEALSGHRPSQHEGILLDNWNTNEDETPHWEALSPIRLATYAHHTTTDAASAYGRLAPLRALGALIPELAPEALDSLRTGVPDSRDLLALGSTYRVSPPSGPLEPLDLVSIAGRLGENIGRTWARIAPYAPLGPAPDIPHAPDLVPLWQDLAILSVHLDGRLPALAGRVPPRHVTLVARETEETEAWVTARLRLYARMFTLDLTALPAPEDA